MKTNLSRSGRGGFLLLEVVLAMGVFAMAATAFAVALHKTADAASLAKERLMITRILDSALTEALSQPVLEETVYSAVLDEKIGGQPVDVDTRIEVMPEMPNKDGQFLQQMFRIEVSAHWYEHGVWKEEVAETWRYGRLYQR